MTRQGTCIACGAPVAAHYDVQNAMIGCAGALLAGALLPVVDRGRLFKLKIQHNHEARMAALQSVRELPSGRWQAQIGGRVRGKKVSFDNRTPAVDAVNEHYNEQMLAFVERRRPKGA